MPAGDEWYVTDIFCVASAGYTDNHTQWIVDYTSLKRCLRDLSMVRRHWQIKMQSENSHF